MVEDKVYFANMNRKITKWKNEHQNISDKRTVWALLKFEIRIFGMQYGARKRKAQKHELNSLLQKLTQLESEMANSAESQEKYLEVSQKIKEIEKIEAQGVIIRSKIQLIEENEKCTKYFLILKREILLIKAFKS